MRTSSRLYLSALLVAALVLPITAAVAVAPTAPTNVSVVNASVANTIPSAAAATVLWTKSVSTVIAYIVTATASGKPTQSTTLTGFSPSAVNLQAVVENLTGGTSYDFSVIAQGADGSYSTPTTAFRFIAQSVPSAPTAVSATPYPGEVVLTWVPPSNDGGPTILGYEITALGVPTETASPDKTTWTVKSLSAGAPITFHISAINAIGKSATADYLAVTLPKTPGAPTSIVATALGSTLTVTWAAPADSGGTAITEYRVYVLDGTGADIPALSPQPPPTGTKVDIKLVPDGTYTVKVAAKNAAGEGPRSAASAQVPIQATVGLTPNTPALSSSAITQVSIGSTTTITATAPSGGVVNITAVGTPAGACTYASPVLSAFEVGTCEIIGEVASASGFDTGLVRQTINVIKADQTITFAVIGNQSGDGSMPLTASSTSGLNVAIQAVGSCAIVGSTLYFAAPGNCTVTASQAGDAHFNAAISAVRAFSISEIPTRVIAPAEVPITLKVVDPRDTSKIIPVNACAELFHLNGATLTLTSAGCINASGLINLSALEGDFKINVFLAANRGGLISHTGKVTSGVLSITGLTPVAGSGIYVVTVLASAITSSPSPTPSASATPTPSASPTPKPTTSASPTPSASPSPSAAVKALVIVVSGSASTIKKTLTSASTTISQKLSKTLRFSIPSIKKGTSVAITLVDPTKRKVALPSVRAAKTGTFLTSALKFVRVGNYAITISAGKLKRSVLVKVTP